MRAGRGRLLGAVPCSSKLQAAPMQAKLARISCTLRSALGRSNRPDHWLLAVRKDLPGHASVDVCTLALQCRVAQQAIHALDALAHAGTPVQGAGEGSMGYGCACTPPRRPHQSLRPALPGPGNCGPAYRHAKISYGMHGGVSSWLVWNTSGDSTNHDAQALVWTANPQPHAIDLKNEI